MEISTSSSPLLQTGCSIRNGSYYMTCTGHSVVIRDMAEKLCPSFAEYICVMKSFLRESIRIDFTSADIRIIENLSICSILISQPQCEVTSYPYDGKLISLKQIQHYAHIICCIHIMHYLCLIQSYYWRNIRIGFSCVLT